MTKFNKNGSLTHATRRLTKLDRDARELFNDYLQHCEKGKGDNALMKVIKRLYAMAIDPDSHPAVATRCCEIILAYGLGKPDVIQHNENTQVNITFIRAEAPQRIKQGGEVKKIG